MAKPRKAKNEDQKVDNSEAVVRHQKLCLSIDMDKRRIYGYTELQIIVPDNGIVGLHADNLEIENVSVDGEAAQFEVFPHYVDLDNDDRWCSVSSATSAADAAGSVYISSLERELVPNLLIMCAKPVHSVSEQLGQMNLENQKQSSDESPQNVKMVRIDYWLEKAETGIHFDENVLHTDNQIRRARCWFPCMDDSLQSCCYDLEFTVASNLVAVSTGTLLYQVLSKDDPLRKTYVYKLNIPVTARWISLAVAPFEILPDCHNVHISHICLPANLAKLRNTVGFFHTAFSHYEDYLSASFPFGSYTQVFISPEMAISSLSFGASMSIFSSEVLYDEKVIDQTIETRIKIAYTLARQWFGVYITAESPNDGWLLDGLAWFLTDSFIKRSLGNNEARYRRYKANCAVCKADDSGATSLGSFASSRDLYGTQCIGFYGKVRSWKSVAILQMLEKQMGPESFRKILRMIVSQSQDATRPLRTLSTKEFRHLANKVGNLERPFLKEFFHRWVGSCGCPVLKMGFSYNKRKNMVELAVLRGCTAPSDSSATSFNGNPESENREADIGWPGMMSIRVHELDGVYDHPILPMAGESWQLLEIQCHSKLAAKRFQKPKKGSKPDGSDDNGDGPTTSDTRSNADTPLLWIRADPEVEYLAEIHFNQPVQMSINQLEKDKDVVAQVQAIATFEALPQLSFSMINALNNFLCDSKAFWRVRIEAAFALANTASEETDWAGLLHLMKFYKSRRFDANIGLPKPNDFHDFPEYFVLEAIPHAIAMVRAADKKSPSEAVEFILQLLKYNDNNGNPYCDVFWLAALVQSIGELEFGQQSILFLSSLLKRIDRLLQFDRLMPSYNGVLTISCIRTLTEIALKLSEFIPLDRVIKLIKPFRSSMIIWHVRMEASRALLDLEFQGKGIDAALILFIQFLQEESSIRGQVKLAVHIMRLCRIRSGSNAESDVKSETLVALLRMLEGSMAFNNVMLRHYLFCILQVLAERSPTLHGVPRDESLRMGHAETCSELKNIFAALVKQSNSPVPEYNTIHFQHDDGVISDVLRETDLLSNGNEEKRPDIYIPQNDAMISRDQGELDALTLSNGHKEKDLGDGIPNDAAGSVVPEEGNILNSLGQMEPVVNVPPDGFTALDAFREAETLSNSHERRKPVFRIRVKQSAASSRADDADNTMVEKSLNGYNETDHGPSSSVSVDAPQKIFSETMSICNHNLEDVNSCHDVGSRMTASIGSAKLNSDELVKELQCTADSSRVPVLPSPEVMLSSSIMKDCAGPETETQKYASLKSLSIKRHELPSNSFAGENLYLHNKGKDKKKDKEKKRKRDEHKGNHNDAEYLEHKRLKKEKRRKEKEISKLLGVETKVRSTVELHNGRKTPVIKVPVISANAITSLEEWEGKKPESETSKAISLELLGKKDDLGSKMAPLPLKSDEQSRSKIVVKSVDSRANLSGGSSSKLKIKIKNRMLSKS